MRIVSRFFMPGDPPTTTNQLKGFGKGHYYKKKVTVEAEKWFAERFEPYVPEFPLKGAISLHSIWYFPIKNKKKWGTWKTSKPDCDNLNKIFQDVAGSCGWWTDDSQVSSLTIEKRYADANEETGIFVEIALLDEGEWSQRR